MPRVTGWIALAAVVVAGAFAACSKSSSEPSPAGEPSAASTAAHPSGSATANPHMANPHLGGAVPTTSGPNASAAELAWDAPSAWPPAPNTSSMRKATYEIPRVAGDTEDAELVVSAAGGGVEPNVKRWAGQFGGAEAKTAKKKVSGLDVTVVELEGTFSGGGPMMGAAATPKEHAALLGAIVDLGDSQYFFKMIGPEKTVTAARKDFDKLVASIHRK